jgi:hypothetical protein
MATTITLRKKERTRNRQSLYLDFYPPIISPKTGKPTRREFLDLFVYKPIGISKKRTRAGESIEIFSKDPSENDKLILHNEMTLNRANQIIRERENEFVKPNIYSNLERDILESKKAKEILENKSFLDYFLSLANKREGSNYKNWLSTFEHLKKYGFDNIRFGQLNKNYCEEFKNYLLNVKANSFNDRKLAKNTVFSYFSKFRAALKQAFKDGLLPNDLNATLTSVKQASITFSISGFIK